ncbi:hypothetical protein COCMIDRAFT_10424 [Bipolaris oryzae ATCC 44560]|uniref:Uncharacterized protein n=1 Tax=Bipolaris oryzae ATCC 44560 TaxID=930090 RepID=W6YJD9_COCMI|nr:uncharacterized protein COCMIDRAFT_10424 [Bipolaris oryzae ATCC 44560]EUC39487.1 hypothetical protein COCMIDRAFT_10424 [Bipolaris oryzae ATCC 44560]
MPFLSLITQATEPISRDDNTSNKSGKHGSKRDRDRSDSLSDSDAQSPRKMPHSHSLWARRSKGSFNNTQYSRESDSDAPASLESHFREPVDAIRRLSIRLPQTPAL